MHTRSGMIRVLLALLLPIGLNAAPKTTPSHAPSSALPEAPLRPIPPDAEVVEITPRFTLKYAAELARRVPPRAALQVWEHAFDFVEAQFPDFHPFAEINRRKPITISIVGELRSDVPAERRLGECSWDPKSIRIRVIPASMKDGTPIHEAVHALLRGNGRELAPWLEEGLAHYLEGRAEEFRDILIRQGVLPLPELNAGAPTLRTRASGLIVVAFLIEKKHCTAQEIARMSEAELPQPFEAWAAFISFRGELARH